jgi:hypothetical protein
MPHPGRRRSRVSHHSLAVDRLSSILPTIHSLTTSIEGSPISEAHEATLDEFVGPAWKKRGGKYKDFSQFLLNRHFKALLSCRVTYSMRMYEVTLVSETLSCVPILFPTLAKELLSLVGSMQVTQPPCKVIEICIEMAPSTPWLSTGSENGLWAPASTTRWLYRPNFVRSDNGVTCKQLLDVLHKHA